MTVYDVILMFTDTALPLPTVDMSQILSLKRKHSSVEENDLSSPLKPSCCTKKKKKKNNKNS